MFKAAIAALTLTALTIGEARPAAAQTIESAAVDAAMQAFMAKHQSCGNKIVTAIDVTPPQGGFTTTPDARPAKPYTIYIESSGLERQWSGQLGKVNEADRLNGLQWKGRVQMVAKAAREAKVTQGGTGPNTPWSSWQSNVTLATIEVEQRNGVWRTSVQAPLLVALGRFAQARRPSCSEIPS